MVEVIDSKGEKLYSINEISKLIGLSKSTTRRIIESKSFHNYLLFKNEKYYNKSTLFNIMKEALEKRIIKLDEL